MKILVTSLLGFIFSVSAFTSTQAHPHQNGFLHNPLTMMIQAPAALGCSLRNDDGTPNTNPAALASYRNNPTRHRWVACEREHLQQICMQIGYEHVLNQQIVSLPNVADVDWAPYHQIVCYRYIRP